MIECRNVSWTKEFGRRLLWQSTGRVEGAAAEALISKASPWRRGDGCRFSKAGAEDPSSQS